MINQELPGDVAEETQEPNPLEAERSTISRGTIQENNVGVSDPGPDVEHEGNNGPQDSQERA